MCEFTPKAKPISKAKTPWVMTSLVKGELKKQNAHNNKYKGKRIDFSSLGVEKIFLATRIKPESRAIRPKAPDSTKTDK